jgi:hypothetical protein
METFIIFTLPALVYSHPSFNPAYLDLIKLFVGTTAWIAGLAGYMYLRERKLKVALTK